mmetsp:Transcript_5527/g.21226  ORF Transcript_5527/g.21226 Transcript_5527/m.21226 type:complete len:270 (-) Transcript_5527:1783-2592(-)
MAARAAVASAATPSAPFPPFLPFRPAPLRRRELAEALPFPISFSLSFSVSVLFSVSLALSLLCVLLERERRLLGGSSSAVAFACRLLFRTGAAGEGLRLALLLALFRFVPFAGDLCLRLCLGPGLGLWSGAGEELRRWRELRVCRAGATAAPLLLGLLRAGLRLARGLPLFSLLVLEGCAFSPLSSSAATLSSSAAVSFLPFFFAAVATAAFLPLALLVPFFFAAIFFAVAVASSSSSSAFSSAFSSSSSLAPASSSSSSSASSSSVRR